MVLYTYDENRDVLIFKNTYDDSEIGQPKKYEIARTHPNAPEEFYFVHIEVRNMDNLPPCESSVDFLSWLNFSELLDGSLILSESSISSSDH